MNPEDTQPLNLTILKNRVTETDVESELANSVYSDRITFEGLRKTIRQAIEQLSNEDLLRHILSKMHRTLEDDEITYLLNYIHNISRSGFDDLEIAPNNDDQTLETLQNELINVYGVTKVMVLEEDYPHKASMIIRMDTRHMNEETEETMLNQIHALIKEYKPERLKRLEITFQNVVVF